MKRGLIIAALAGAVVTFSAAAMADSRECAQATNRYDMNRASAFDALRSYGNCLSRDDGRDECERQFSALDSAQNNFESAVSNFRDDCE